MRSVLLLASTLICVLAAPAGASAVRPAPELVIQDDAQFLHRPHLLDWSLARTREMGFTTLRVTAGWNVLTRNPDSAVRPVFDAADPGAYEQDRWVNLDRLVRAADAAGLKVMIDIAFWAPRWVAGPDPAGKPDRNNVRIDVDAYRDFALAVARRYNGRFAGLPAVHTFTIWNEPNHPGFLQPQWERFDGRWTPSSPTQYRHMVHSTYPALKQIRPDSRILIGGLASTGSHTPGQRGIPPLKFLRSMTCVDRKLQPLRSANCADFQPVPGDGFSYHPYSLHIRPDGKLRGDDAPIGQLSELSRLLDQLAARGRIAPAVRDLYLTEYGYETRPPDPRGHVTGALQARYLTWARYLAWRNPRVKMHPQFLLRDMPCVTGRVPCGDWQSGVYTVDGQPKPAVRAFREAGVFARRERRSVLLWAATGPAVIDGSARFQFRGRDGRWHTVRRGRQLTAAGVTWTRIAPTAATRFRLTYRTGQGRRRSASVPAVR